MQTKLQTLGFDINPRRVFLSWIPDDFNFARHLVKIFTTKLKNRADANGRMFRVDDPHARMPGSMACLLPWETAPTDVVVFFSDEYAENRVSHTKVDSATSPELNFLLETRLDGGDESYSIWLAVVHSARWDNVVVGGRLLGSDYFEPVLHHFRPKGNPFCSDFGRPHVLLEEATQASDLLCDHDSVRCDLCELFRARHSSHSRQSTPDSGVAQ